MPLNSRFARSRCFPALFCFSLWPTAYTRSRVFSRPIFASAHIQLYASQCVCPVNVVYFQIFDYQAPFPCRIISACVLGGFVLPAAPSPLILITAFYLSIVHKRHNGIQALIRPVLSLSLCLSLLFFSFLSFSLSLIISILCPLLCCLPL